MKRVRIGNDIPVEWHIISGGAPADMSSRKVAVKVFDQNMRPCPFAFSIEGNVVRGVFEGRYQRRTGVYSTMLVINPNNVGMYTFDHCKVFELVSHTCLESGDSTSGIVLECRLPV